MKVPSRTSCASATIRDLSASSQTATGKDPGSRSARPGRQSLGWVSSTLPCHKHMARISCALPSRAAHGSAAIRDAVAWRGCARGVQSQPGKAPDWCCAPHGDTRGGSRSPRLRKICTAFDAMIALMRGCRVAFRILKHADFYSRSKRARSCRASRVPLTAIVHRIDKSRHQM